MPSKKVYQLLESNNEKQDNIIRNYLSNISLFIFITCCILSLFLLTLIPSFIFPNDNRCIIPNIAISEENHCEGKYIYVLDLPSKYNQDFLENCSILNPFFNECKVLTNSGLGPKLTFSNETVFSGDNWFETDQFSLEVIIHNRIKQYKCLTNDSSHANAIFVPFYSGLDVGRYLWSSNITLRDETSMDLAKYLVQKPEWKRFGGRDHFLIAGRITWDFGRRSDNTSTPEGWGNHLLDLPEFRNMTTLLLEASPTSKSEMGIPYPTYFHPSSGNEVVNWQEKMREKPRPHLYSFAGAPRPYMKDSLRNVIIDQCLASRARHCEFLHVNLSVTPENIMNLFQKSDFCLQPPGDSYTRKSTFDTILAGCIPVLFHPGSAYVHYIWHLPKDYSRYSVFIPMDEVMEGKVSIEKILLKIPKEKIRAMREEVIKLIPRIVYANPNSDVDDLEDAFDVLVQGVLSRVEKLKREINEGKNATSESVVPDTLAWKYKFFGDLENKDWDKYFGFL
ncbi:putative xyloglucan galactosyltransferase GT11 [Silene latifolia]|uniref:putative xyloglucan galactosyltransferase GT11 n=1 Tax=Silene latifolia TaxID=37657 RepID=UPI003D779DE1